MEESQNLESPEKKRNWLLIIIITLIVICILVACVSVAILLLVGPAVGNVFSNVIENMPPTPAP